MKLLSFGLIAFSLAFCGLGDKLKSLSGSSNTVVKLIFKLDYEVHGHER